MKRILILVALFAVLTAGCRADVRLLLDVTEDGSGTLSSEVGIDQQLRDLIDRLAGDSEAIISGLDLGLVGEGDTQVEGDMTVYTTEVAFDDVDTISEAAAGHFTSFSLVLDDEGTALEATLDLAGELDITQFPIDPSTIDSETLEAQIIVSLPGEIDTHNADNVLADGRYSWNIPLDGELYMFVNTVYPKAGFPWWLVGLLALSVALAGAVWWAAVRLEKRGSSARPPAPTPPPIDGPPVADSPGGVDLPEPSDSSQRTASPFFEIDSD